jgi:hypothetical protein
MIRHIKLQQAGDAERLHATTGWQRRARPEGVSEVDRNKYFGGSLSKERLPRGSSWAFGERLGGAVIGLVTNGLLARLLSPPESGAYFPVLSMISLRALVGSLGLPKAVVRCIAENLTLDQFGRTRRVIYTVLGIGVLGTLGGGRNHRTAERDHGADRQEAGRDVDPRELLPFVVPVGPFEPVSAPRRGGTSPVFRRLASRRSTEDVGWEVRRGETLG